MRVSTLSNKIGFSCFCLLTAEIGVGAGDFFHTLYIYKGKKGDGIGDSMGLILLLGRGRDGGKAKE
jgi:hypothetical protein